MDNNNELIGSILSFAIISFGFVAWYMHIKHERKRSCLLQKLADKHNLKYYKSLRLANQPTYSFLREFDLHNTDIKNILHGKYNSNEIVYFETKHSVCDHDTCYRYKHNYVAIKLNNSIKRFWLKKQLSIDKYLTKIDPYKSRVLVPLSDKLESINYTCLGENENDKEKIAYIFNSEVIDLINKINRTWDISSTEDWLLFNDTSNEADYDFRLPVSAISLYINNSGTLKNAIEKRA